MSANLLNYILIAVYFLNSIWWVFQKDYAQSLYHFAAFLITVSVVWGMGK